MRVHHLNCGTMRPLGGRLIDGRPGLLRHAEMVCHCLLVESDAGLVLVETGVGTPATTRPDEWLGKAFVQLTHPAADLAESAVEQITRLGHRPEDVRHIVLTHLDLDHAGGLVNFPEATVHVYAAELDALRNPRGARERHRYRAQQFEHGPRFRPYQVGGEQWFGFDAVRELDGLGPEILIVPLAGHSRGHAGVAVDTGDGWLLNAGDSYFFHGQLEPRPHMPAGLAAFESIVQAERGPRRENQRRLRELVADHGDEVTLFSAHDAAEFYRSVAPTASGWPSGR